MQNITLTLSLLTAVAALVASGCETSNQSYSSSSRVIDATEGNSSPRHTTTSRPHNRGPEVLTDAPVFDPNTGTVNTLTPAPQGSLSQNLGPNPGTQNVTPAAPAAPSTLIGGVPDEPMVSFPTNQGQVSAPPPEPAASSTSGNWLLVDSAEAKKDESNTALEQQVLAQQSVSESARTVYQNKIATTAGPDRYAVVKGDTLYSIAFRYGLDYHALAKINNIEPPYNLAVGQVLVLNLKAQEAPSYIVKKGDTLYSIAKNNGQSVSFLAGVNNLEPPYTLEVGQKILLSRDKSMTASASATAQKENVVPVAGQKTPTTTASTTTKPSTDKKDEKPVAPKPQIIDTPSRKVAGVTWSWPTTGKVIEQFSTAEQGNKGIDISGKRGQNIIAAADGQVVYSGNALRGFGNLIIINHTNEYLSAYAHNDELLVKEGQKVKRGQQIARMGSTDASSPRLHFEIRYRGQSVNPISYLPK